jgi:hypothetical protein
MEDPIQRITKKQKGYGEVAQAVESLPSKHQALSSTPSTTKKETVLRVL